MVATFTITSRRGLQSLTAWFQNRAYLDSNLPMSVNRCASPKAENLAGTRLYGSGKLHALSDETRKRCTTYTELIRLQTRQTDNGK